VYFFALEWVVEIRWHTAHAIVALDEQMTIEHYTGHMPNIAALCTYSFYDYCWYWSSEEGFPDQQWVLGHWLGVSHDIGAADLFCPRKIISADCEIMHHTSDSGGVAGASQQGNGRRARQGE
jgi:hypothetical protein